MSTRWLCRIESAPALISRIRRAARHAAVYALYASGLTRLAKAYVRRHGAVVLTLHRVLSEVERQRSGSLPGMVVSEATFSALLEYLTATCEIVPLSSSTLAKRQVRSHVPVAITFDDGWQDTFATAFPVMQRYKAPFAVFVCSGLAGRSKPFWPELVAAAWRNPDSAALLPKAGNGLEAAVEYLKRVEPLHRDALLARVKATALELREGSAADGVDCSMDWGSVRGLAIAGVAIGSHTSSHQILTRVSQTVAAEEISGSRRTLERELEKRCDLFSYPNGDWSESIRTLVARAGYRLGFTTEPGVWDQQADTLLIPRINVSEAWLVGARGNFSRAMCEYRLFWTAAWAHFRLNLGRRQAGRP